MTTLKNTDILAHLEKVMQSNTMHYQSDFQYDVETLQNAALLPNMEDRQFYWMSRPSGTWCVLERSAFLREAEAHTIWTYHEGETEKIKAYRIVVTGQKDGVVMGDLYELDYAKQVARVKKNALPVSTVTLTFASGQTLALPYKDYDGNRRRLMEQHGTIIKTRYVPENEAELTSTIFIEHRYEKG